MSVTPEPISRKDERQSDSISSNNAQTPEESFLLPSILRGAAYISSGGRVYRLFSDNDEISFPMASFEKTLQLDPLPEIPSIENFVSPSPLEDFVSSLEDSSEPLINLLSVSSVERVKNIPATPSILQLKQQPPTLSITESIKESSTENHPQENHSQEYSVPKNLPSKEKTDSHIENYKIFSETEQEEQIDAPPRTPLYQLIQENPILKLFEAFPELTVSSDVSLTETSATVDSPTPKSTTSKEKETELTVTPIVQPIHLEVPHQPGKPKHCFQQLSLRHLEKIQNSQPTEQDNTSKSVVDIPVMVADENSDRFIPQVDAELIIPPETNRFSSSETRRSSLETKPSLPNPSQPEPSQPEPPLSELLQPEPLLPELSQSESPLSELSQAELSLSELLQQESSLSERSQPESSLSESLPFEPSLPETSLPETLQPEPLLPESSTLELPEHKSATLPFPLRESLPVEANPANHSGNDNGTWQLIWQSHWPEHLKSLELAASDQICFLADHLEIQKEQKHKIFSFNSVQSGDGCTTLALCASRELAERGYRVLLVDAHRQHPELPQLLHLKINPEFCEIITLIPDRLELLPWSETSIEINHTTQSFAEIVGSFRDDYDFILLDNGSLVEYPLSEHVLLWREMSSDGVILVLNTKNPAPVSVRTIAQRLLQNQINLLGIVENYV